MGADLPVTQRLKLGNAALERLPINIARPTYDRSKLTAGIVHIGVGNFHRAHQAWYLHRLLQQGLAHDWAILGAGVKPYDAHMREKLLAQDCLTTLVELGPASTSAEVTGAMIDYLPVEESNAALIRAMADPSIRIVALTVTEGGYFIDPVTNEFDLAHPDVQHDLRHPDTPRTAFGAMVAALKLRRKAGHPPFTGLCCDNLQYNGAILKQAIVSIASRQDSDLAGWIETKGAFPNSMVDCIVPATGSTELELARSFGLEDAAPVTHENFRQWVIEDKFCAGRPDWELVGATFTDSVHAYEAMKIRVLNAGHQILANAGELLCIETIAECMAHPRISALFRKVQHEEIAPYVPEVPGMSRSAYIELIERRFANSAIRDTTRRVAFDGSSRHPGFVLPILRDALAAGGSVEGLSLIEALWARMCAGIRENGSRIDPNDTAWESLAAAAEAARSDPQAWLEQGHFYGDLAHDARFADSFADWLRLIWSHGCEEAIVRYCGVECNGEHVRG